jgi:hypothetical protein
VATTLPEIGVIRNANNPNSWGKKTLDEALPRKCPHCNAGFVKIALHILEETPVTYACGGYYKYKSQIQTHTFVYYGVCGKGG